MIPVIHTTDLHHTPNDPDDHFDLAALYALDELDLRAVILDYSEEEFGTTVYEPGYVPVAQLNFLTGRAVPAATGPTKRHKLAHPGDTLEHLPVQEEGGIRLLIKALRESPEPAYITVVGSCRPLAAACNREPELFRQKTKAVVLCAGSARNNENVCYNTKLDPHAMHCIWQSGLPIHWLPCVGNLNYPNYHAPNNGHFVAPYSALLDGLDNRLLNWFLHALWGNMRGDIIRALHEANRHEIFRERMTQGTRNIFSLGAFILMAGRELVKTADGWRFMPKGEAPVDLAQKRMRWVPVKVKVLETGNVHWQPTSGDTHVQFYEREPGEEENKAMAEALNALLQGIPL